VVERGHCKGRGFYLCYGKEYQLALSILEVLKFRLSTSFGSFRLI
jgi:hypothetical protein